MNKHQIEALLDPAVYPEPTSRVQLLQTHISYLFVTDRYVYKIKKPVDLGFLDFTTLERRRFSCHEELRLNRRLAPDTYLAVVPVRATAGGATFRGCGEVIDHAVKMVRLPEELMMSPLLEQEAVTAGQIRTLARIIARFHQTAATGPGITTYGTPTAIRATWALNFGIVEPFVGRTVTRGDFDLIRGWVGRFLDDHAPLFERRVAEGFIREGDGDLHSGNICLTEPPVIFDCIEFAERFRCLDTAADIAFLLMDLEYYRAGLLADLFVREYCAATGDGGVRPLLPFYQVSRAFVRGEVESIKAAAPELSGAERDAADRSARGHFRLARGLIIRQGLPLTLLITCGLSGSGKSALAEELSFQLGLVLISSDRERKRLAGVPPTARSTAGYDDGIYRSDHTRRTYDRLHELAGTALGGGRSVIVDATFRDPEERRRFRDLAAARGARFVILALCCPEPAILERLDAREGRSDVVSDARREVYLRQREEFHPPETAEGEVMVVDTTASLLHTVDTLLTSLGVLPCGHT